MKAKQAAGGTVHPQASRRREHPVRLCLSGQDVAIANSGIVSRTSPRAERKIPPTISSLTCARSSRIIPGILVFLGAPPNASRNLLE